jgi:hypothetical protein
MNDPQRPISKSTLMTVLLRFAAVAAVSAAVVPGWSVRTEDPSAEHALEGGSEIRQPALQHGQPAAEPRPAAPLNPDPDVPPDRPVTGTDAESELPRLIVGTWQDDYQGRRTMTLRPDGTGTMVVELQGINAALFASRLTFHMEWSLQGRRLHKRTVGGEPAVKVRAVLAMMGDEVEEEVVELTTDRLLVKQTGSEQQFDWRRAPP